VTTGLDGHWSHDVLILGADPLPQLAGGDHAHPAAGLLGECFREDLDTHEPVEPWWDFETGLWFTCDTCGKISVFHSVQSFAGRPCGHYGGGNQDYVDLFVIRNYWAQATNTVKWGRR